MFRDVQAGWRLTPGMQLAGVLAKLPVVMMPVSVQRYPDYLGWSRWFYGDDTFPCLHLIWPDKAGAFLWDARFSLDFAGLQPDLTDGGWRAALAN